MYYSRSKNWNLTISDFLFLRFDRGTELVFLVQNLSKCFKTARTTKCVHQLIELLIITMCHGSFTNTQLFND